MTNEVEKNIDKLVKILWDYHHLNHTLKPADLIFGLGSHDIRVAERAAELYLGKYAPKVIFSGGFGRLTEGDWDKAEADTFAEVAIRMGVPPEDVLIENRATNTGENISLGYETLKAHHIFPKKIILVQKPYMERRTYATFMKQWPGEAVEIVEIMVTSPQIPLEEYSTDPIFREKFINAMVGDTQRIKLYEERGFQIPQEMPDDVWSAYEELVRLGYDKQLMQ